jgi:thiamine pyrophosphate-dependent acetolactate synthase large subunit-like protein
MNHKKPVTMTGAQAVMESLVMKESILCSDIPGGAIMPVYDAFYSLRTK